MTINENRTVNGAAVSEELMVGNGTCQQIDNSHGKNATKGKGTGASGGTFHANLRRH